MDKKYRLELYVAGKDKVEKLLKELNGPLAAKYDSKYHIEVVDVLEEPERAQDKKVFITPTLVKILPPPIKKIIGDFSKKENVLVALGLEEVEE